MKMFGVTLNEKESKYIRHLYRRMSDESFNELSDEDKLHRILLSCIGENSKTSWSDEDLSLFKTDMTDKEIADLTGRSRKAVYNMRSRFNGKKW